MSEPQARPPAGTAFGLEPCTRLAHARPSQSRSGTRGWKALDSSTGFRLPDDSVLSPDVSLVALDRWQCFGSIDGFDFSGDDSPEMQKQRQKQEEVQVQIEMEVNLRLK